MPIDLTKKKILITGAHGFLGKHLVENLLKKRRVPKENLFLPTAEKFDLRKWENCQKAVKNQDIIIHLAAVTGGLELHRTHPGKIFYDNIIMSTQLIEAARQIGVEKFVGIGSVTEYPETALAPFREEDIWKGPPEKIHAPYSFAKKMALIQSQAYRQEYDFNAIHLLFPSIFGPGMNLQTGYLIPSVIEKIHHAKKTGKEFIEMWGSGRSIRDFLYVEDAAEGIVLATESYNKSEPVNLGSGRPISIKDLICLICRLMDFKGEVRWGTTRPDGQPRQIMDVSKAKNEFNFVAKIPVEVGLEKTIEWYLNYG